VKVESGIVRENGVSRDPVLFSGGKWNFPKDRIDHFKGHHKFLFTGGKFELEKRKIAIFSGPPENNTGFQEQSILSLNIPLPTLTINQCTP
jgi:hypothetical protein